MKIIKKGRVLEIIDNVKCFSICGLWVLEDRGGNMGYKIYLINNV